MHNTNSLRDEVHIQHQKLSGQPFSKKMEYFLDYYKVHTIIIVLLACMFGSILHSIITQKETVLSIAYINAFPNVEDEIFIDDFENYLGINLKKQQVVLDSGYYIEEESTSPYALTYSQKFSTNAMAGKLDVVLADTTNFDFYGSQGFFYNLNVILPPEVLAQYTHDLYYADLPTDEISEEVPIGIKINKANKICETACYPNTDAYFGFVAGSEYVDNALSYLNYLTN